MHATRLCKVGGSIMLAVSSVLLDLLTLRVGAQVEMDVEDGRSVIEPKARPGYSLDELLAQCDDTEAPSAEDRAWLDDKPVGNELS